MAGLLRGIARTAVISGTATAVSNNVSRRQAQRFAEKDQQAYVQQQQTYQQQAPQQQSYQEDVDFDEQLAQLSKLGQLRDQGILTQQEFEAKKRQILGV
ncbi:SHOCT domain-containing protein [Acetobacterium malicum]|uniref:SHOCT domain-containing protein n=1 Tax=Acetobacterium malicum TaxID=52692 RepID=A0ABR6YYE8_9FIRM|nr:SHOCT domain-containing protein [Acetobacterium malicum]MBC3900141.1 SHOCT domain-containing protein [Acetobacterium malicum]